MDRRRYRLFRRRDLAPGVDPGRAVPRDLPIEPGEAFEADLIALECEPDRWRVLKNRWRVLKNRGNISPHGDRLTTAQLQIHIAEMEIALTGTVQFIDMKDLLGNEPLEWGGWPLGQPTGDEP